MSEKWLKIPDSIHHEVSNYGRLRNGLTKKILKTSKNQGGYYLFTHRRSINNRPTTKYMHRIVAELFVSNPNNYKEVNHINGDKSDNSSNNLEWVTRQENCLHAIESGLNEIGGYKNNRAKLDADALDFALDLYYRYNVAIFAIASMLMVNFHTIDKVIKNISYKKEQLDWRMKNADLISNFKTRN